MKTLIITLLTFASAIQANILPIQNVTDSDLEMPHLHRRQWATLAKASGKVFVKSIDDLIRLIKSIPKPKLEGLSLKLSPKLEVPYVPLKNKPPKFANADELGDAGKADKLGHAGKNDEIVKGTKPDAPSVAGHTYPSSLIDAPQQALTWSQKIQKFTTTSIKNFLHEIRIGFYIIGMIQIGIGLYITIKNKVNGKKEQIEIDEKSGLPKTQEGEKARVLEDTSQFYYNGHPIKIIDDKNGVEYFLDIAHSYYYCTVPGTKERKVYGLDDTKACIS